MAGDQFPLDIIYNILSRLPIKSLARFQCVCKLWLKYINDPYLQTIHVKEEPTPIMFEDKPIHPNKHCKISSLHVIQGTTTTTVNKEPLLEFSYKCSREYHVLGSCNGLITLVCYERDPSNGTFLAIINPLTKQRYNLPPIMIRSSRMDKFDILEAAGIGFDDCTNTLTTVCVIFEDWDWDWVPPTRTQVRTIVHHSGMDSWREIAKDTPYMLSGESVFAHGRLYWLDGSYYHVRNNIVWFDVKMEVFGSKDPPERCVGVDRINQQLVDLNGEVGVVYRYDDIDHYKVWVLKGERWVWHCLIELEWPCYTAKVSGCWNEDGDILLSSNGGKRLYVYTLKTGDLRVIDRHERYEADIRMYRSNFLSIRGINTGATSAYSIENKV